MRGFATTCGRTTLFTWGFELCELPCVAANAPPPPTTASATSDEPMAALRPSMDVSFRSSRKECLTFEVFLGFGDPRFERGPQRLAHRCELDPVEHVLEEPAHDQPLRLRASEAARHQVEELFAVDLAERRAVRAADVVRHDLEPGDRVRVRLVGEQQVAVLLVGVRLLRALLDADHPAPDRARVLTERALEGEVALGARCDVLLERVVVEVLGPVGEVRAGDARGGARAGQDVTDPE